MSALAQHLSTRPASATTGLAQHALSITPELQALTLLRHKACTLLCRHGQYGRAGITIQRKNGKAHFIFEGAEILCLDAGYDPATVHEALIRHLNAWTRAVLDEVSPIFQTSIDIPARHTLRLPSMSLDVSDYSFTGSVSVFIWLQTPDMNDADQFRVQFRMFPHESKAILFMSYGPQHDGIAKDLLQDREAFVYADTPTQMAQMLIERYNAAMARMHDSP